MKKTSMYTNVKDAPPKYTNIVLVDAAKLPPRVPSGRFNFNSNFGADTEYYTRNNLTDVAPGFWQNLRKELTKNTKSK